MRVLFTGNQGCENEILGPTGPVVVADWRRRRPRYRIHQFETA